MQTVALRYAAALVNLALESEGLEVYKKWVETTDQLFSSSEDVQLFLRSAFIDKAQKYQLLETLDQQPLIHTTNFLKLLIDRDRIILFHEICKQFIKLANQLLRIVDAIIFSKDRLNKGQLDKIKLSLEKQFNATVTLENKIDATLLGGMKVNILGQTLDYSLDEKLANLKRQLLERGKHHAT